MPEAETCGFEGDPDVYGVGIRIGFYAQALAAWYTNYFVASEARSLRSTNLTFLLALFISISILLLFATSKYAVEVFLLLQIDLVMIYMTLGNTQIRYSTLYLRMSASQKLLYHIINLSGAVFSVWFWWAGLDILDSTPCGTFVWAVVKVEPYGWFRTCMKVYSTLQLVTTTFATDSINHITTEFRFRNTKQMFLQHVKSHEKNAINSNKRLEIQQQKGSGDKSKPLIEISEYRYQNEASFEKVLEGEKYLDEIFGECMSKESDIECKNYDSHPSESRKGWAGAGNLVKDNIFVWKTMVKWYASRSKARPFFQLKKVLARHMKRLRLNSRMRGPDLFRKMASRDMPSVGWKTLMLASDIQLSQLPLLSNRSWYVRAVFELLVIGWLVVEVELTIAWNHISGLTNLESFGQVLAFTLGVGGLVNVLWKTLSNKIHGIKQEDIRPDETEYERGFKVYLEWKWRREQAFNQLLKSSIADCHDSIKPGAAILRVSTAPMP